MDKKNTIGYDTSLFPKNFLEQFTLFKLLLKKKRSDESEGKEKTLRAGSSFDFSGYFPYNWGDDLRYVDWNVYARLDQLIVKKFLLPQRLQLLIFLDASASMNIGKPSKFHRACRLAAILGYLGQQNGHSVRFAFLQEEKAHLSPPFFYGQSYDPMLCFLSWQKASGKIFMERLLLFLISNLAKSSIFLCSDLLDAQNSKKIFELIRSKGHDLTLLHLLATEEMMPSFTGKVILRDVETHCKKMLILEKESLKNYQQMLKNFQEQWSFFCHRHGIQYFPFFLDQWTSESLHGLVYKSLSASS